MDANFRQALERAIAALPTRNVFKSVDDEFGVHILHPVESWRRHTEPCRQAGSLILGEDASGNYFLYAPDGSVSFWDHETDEETVLTASVAEFCDSLVEPTPVVLRPGQVKRAWIDPAFLEDQRKKGDV